MKTTLATIVSAAAVGVFSRLTVMDPAFVPPLDNSILDKPSAGKFMDPNIPVLVVDHLDAKRETEPEPDPNRNVTLQDGLVFVLQCTEAGFREPCLVYGAPPGACVSYFNFQSRNDTSVSDKYNDKVKSISTNTGGNCQFYKFRGCNNKGDDRGLTVKYNYNLAVAPPEDDRVPEYDENITSWRC